MGREKDTNGFSTIDELDELDLDLDILETTEDIVEEEEFELDDISYRNQIREEERRQIEEFLKNTVMVRCERYNANLTAWACKNKKEAPPPRLRAALSEEENLNNHPCFGCVGPIIINWPMDRPPIPLYEIEEKPIISHPNLEDDFTLARERQIEIYRQRELGVPEGEEAKEGDQKAEEPESKGASTEKEEVAELKTESEPALQSKGETEEKPKEKKKAKESTQSEIEVDTAEAKEADKAKLPAEKGEEKSAKEEKKKGRRKKEKKQPEACAICGRPYTPKYWRGDICNPCYAKKLRERKKQAKKKEKEKKEKTTPTKKNKEHPPCAICGRPYTPKYWRGDICNPCYAKKLRERKKKQKESEKASTKKEKKSKSKKEK